VRESCQQFNLVKWREVAGWCVREFSWKSACEEQTRKLVWNGRQPRTLLDISCQLRDEFCTVGWQENLSARSWRISLGRSCYQETTSGDCNRLRTLVCVYQYSVKCSSKWCTQVVNKSIHQSIPSRKSLYPVTMFKKDKNQYFYAGCYNHERAHWLQGLMRILPSTFR
jgi:hypothetical protein